MAALKVAKKELRQRIKHILSEVSPEITASQTARALNVLFALPEYQRARRISVYLSMPSGEISTAGIVKDALQQGKKVFVPYIYKLASPTEGQPSSIMDMLELHSIKDFEGLGSDKWGIPTPDEQSVGNRKNSFGGQGPSEGRIDLGQEGEAGLDLIVMPGMAFDSSMGRLGHGKGFYDFFLQRCFEQSKQRRGVKMPYLVGLALKEQLLPQEESVPVDPTDWRLDALIVGDGRLLRAANP